MNAPDHHQSLERPRGKSSVHRQQIIKGEAEEDISRYPYTVSLLKRNKIRNSTSGPSQIYHTCGGVLIAPDIILSAGHCLNHTHVVHVNTAVADHEKRMLQSKNNTVNEGNNNGSRIKIYGTDPVKRGKWGQAFGIKEEWKIIHPLYSEENMTHDLMIIKLPKAVEGIAPIRLNRDQSVPSEEDNLTVLGWGFTIDDCPSSVSEILLRANLHYVNKNICQFIFDGVNHKITDDVLCGHSDDGQDSCSGDSGGPMVVKRSENPSDHVLVGIVSWGIGCGLGIPGIYARVSSTYSWIQEQVCRLSAKSCDEKRNIINFEICQEFHMKYFETKGKNTRKNCKWVGRDKDVRCIRHKDKCPLTCEDPRCSV